MSISYDALSSLTNWAKHPGSSRLLVLEDGSSGNISPLVYWLGRAGASFSYQVISASIGPTAALVLERDILVKLHNDLYPDDLDEPALVSLATLRGYVRSGLQSIKSGRARLVALDRLNWGEKSFRENLEYLLGLIESKQKIAVSIRLEAGHEPNIAEWCERLGWHTEETLCLRLPARLDGELPPKEQAQRWIDTCVSSEAPDAGHITDVLDALAVALRPMCIEEIAALLGLSPSGITSTLNLAPKGAIAIDHNDRYAFRDEAVARAWAELRSEANARIRERVLALGEAVIRGETQHVVPYVIEHYGALLAEHREPSAQLSLVREAWSNAWSSLNNLLGFEADVERVWSTNRRELLACASAPEAQRAATLLTYYRCLQVSVSTVHRVCNFDSTAEARAGFLAAIAEELDEPQRTWAREQAAFALLAAPISVGGADLLVRLARWFEGERRKTMVAKVLEMYRVDTAKGASSAWMLRAAPMLSAVERRALYDEVIDNFRELSTEDAWALRDALNAVSSPSEIAQRFISLIPSLSQPDRFRLRCALAPHLEGDLRQTIVNEILTTVEAGYFPLDSADLKSVAPALDVEQLVRLWHGLRTRGFNVHARSICIRTLCARGHANAAESLAGPDLTSWLFDWVLALAVNLRDHRPELREELVRRLSLITNPGELSWTIDRDATELVSVLGVDSLLGLTRTLPAGEERVVAQLALVPFASEAEKHILVAEAVSASRNDGEHQSDDAHGLLMYWEWMSIPDLCYSLVHSCRSMDGLSILEDIAPFLKRFGGRDLPLKLAEQIVDVARWAP